MTPAELDRLRVAVNQLSMRQMILGEALGSTLRALPPDQAKAIAEDFRQRIAFGMQEFADRLTPADDETMTVQIAAILEACGMPPKRSS